MLPDAVWRDPHAVEQWAAKLPPGCSLVVYCVRGHEVSRGVRDVLRCRGDMAAESASNGSSSSEAQLPSAPLTVAAFLAQ